MPNAQLVVDHFHVVQLANQALTEIRRRVTVQVRGRRGRKGNHEWELRNRLTRNAARTHGEHVDQLCDQLEALPPKIGSMAFPLAPASALALTTPELSKDWFGAATSVNDLTKVLAAIPVPDQYTATRLRATPLAQVMRGSQSGWYLVNSALPLST